MAVSVYTGASSSDVVYVNYTGDTPTKDNITNMTEVVQAYNAGKVIAIKAFPNPDVGLAGKVPFFLSEAINNNGAVYIFDFVSDKILQMGEEETNNVSCPYCIRIQCNRTQTNTGFEYTVSSVLVGLARSFPATHADTHKIGGIDPIVPSDIGAQSKITANGILKGDGAGNITAADETEVELVDLPQEVFWATYGETTKAEMLAAQNANKLILCAHNSHVFILEYTGTFWLGYAISGGLASIDTFFVQFANDQWMASNRVTAVNTFIRPISLPVASWTGSDPYTQSITMTGVSSDKYTVDIQLSEELYDQLVSDNVGYLVIKNNGGQLTAVAKGGKPSVDLTVQARASYNAIYAR